MSYQPPQQTCDFFNFSFLFLLSFGFPIFKVTQSTDGTRTSSIPQQPPPSIWNANTVRKESELNSLKSQPSKHRRVTGKTKNKISNTAQSIISNANSNSPGSCLGGQYTTEPITLKVPASNANNFLNKKITNKLRSKNVVSFYEDNAAAVIQRAYRMYRSRKRQIHKAQKEHHEGSRNFHNSKTNQTKTKESFRTNIASSDKVALEQEKCRYWIYKDYLKEGSLYFPERESVIVFGGIDPHSKYGDGKNTGRNIFRYNSELNQWDLVGELPQPRHHHAVAFLKGKIFLAGGTDPRDDEKGKTIVVGTVWSFDPVSRSWYKETEMLTPRKNFGLAVMKGKLLAIGGQDKDGRILSSVERFDPSKGVWEYIASLNIERTGMATAKYNDTIWVAGGMTSSRKTPLTSSVESYDYKSNVWNEQSHLRFPRCFGCLFSMNDNLYFIGGAGRASERERTTSSFNAIDVWNPEEKEWKLHFAMSLPRHGHAVAYLGTQILIIGGVTTAYLRALTDVECFCCERKTWIKGLTGLPVPLSGHGAVTLPPASLISITRSDRRTSIDFLRMMIQEWKLELAAISHKSCTSKLEQRPNWKRIH